jgi:NitT/TauT family transport system substrate-binding protein
MHTYPAMLKALRWVVVCLAVAGCKKGDSASGEEALRLGFFPNVTHSQALVGNHDGTFARALGPTKLETRQFNAGPTAMEALLSGSIDVSYVGTGPAINAYLKGDKQLRVIAGAVNGGAVLVTRTASSAAELRGKKVASPQMGNTQDIALRHWLKQNGLEPGKDVQVVTLANPEIQGLFEREELEGAWVPEPWGARLVAAGGKVLVDERDLWPERKFHTTVIVTTRTMLEKRPDALRKLLQAHVELTRRWEQEPGPFTEAVNKAFAAQTGQALDAEVAKVAFSRLEPELHPSEEHLKEVARHSKGLGYLPTDEIAGIVNTGLLDEILEARAQPKSSER